MEINVTLFLLILKKKFEWVILKPTNHFVFSGKFEFYFYIVKLTWNI